MKPNTISVEIHYVNGGYQQVFNEEPAKKVLEEYLFPDSGMPITYTITAATQDGKMVSIVIDSKSGRVSGFIE